MKSSTVIIGAGSAGLAAAAELARQEEPVRVLEARDRVGGRVHTVRDPEWPLPIERGAEFIHGRPAETWGRVHHAGLHAYDFVNSHWGSHDGKPVTSSSDWPEVERIMGRLDRVPAADCSFEQFLREYCQDCSPGAVAMAKAFVEGLDAADASIVSARSIRQSEKDGAEFDADAPFRLLDGYDRLLDTLVRRLPPGALQLNCVVEGIEWAPGRVTVRTRTGETLTAGRAVITLPVGVLLAPAGEPGAIRFDPPLPAQAAGAIQQMRMGPVVKVLLRFRSAFWEQGPWRDLGFLHEPLAAFPTWWTALPFRVPLLTAWAGGPAAAALSHRPAAEVLEVAVRTLAGLIGVAESKLHDELVQYHVADWQADPFARGAYAFSRVGGEDAARRLAEPVEETLYFAGEATHPGYAGTVAAALASGVRAARQICGSSRNFLA